MILDTLTEFHIFYCGKGNHNKVWGYFQHGNTWWTYWGGVGKAWTFKQIGSHESDQLYVEVLSEQKIKKGYEITSHDLVDDSDPEWRMRFCERLTLTLLQITKAS